MSDELPPLSDPPEPDSGGGLRPEEPPPRVPSRAAGPWTPPTPEELAELLPQYRIVALLGRGGMGAVYKGEQATLERPVAIKLLPAELAADGQFIARFRREARTLARLQHPGIVAVYDFGQTPEGHLYFVMEYVDGTDLHRVLHGPGLKPGQALELIGQVCDALQYAHRQGVIHRDIKPANILLNMEGRAKLGDFGLARPLTGELHDITSTNVVMGTPDYMAPEQRVGLADHRADIFALGVMLYEMLTGRTPRGVFEPPSKKVAVDVRIDQVVLKALQSEPELRYQHVSELKIDLDRIRTTRAVPIATPRPKRRGENAKPYFVAAAAGFVALAGGLGLHYWPQPAPAPALPPPPPSTPAATPVLVAVATTPLPTPAPTPRATPVAPPVATPTPKPTTPVATTPAPQLAAMTTPVPVIVATIATPRPAATPPASTPRLGMTGKPLVTHTNVRDALIGAPWTWTGLAGAAAVSWTEVRFTGAGSYTAYSGSTTVSGGRWQQAGSNRVNLGRSLILIFDDQFTEFTGMDENGISRYRGRRKL